MRRVVAGTASVALVALLVLVVPAPAYAAAPVQAFPWMPSSLVAGTTDAPPAPPSGTSVEDWDEWRARDREYRRQLIDQAKTRSWTPQQAPQPVAPPKQPTRGPTGGPLGMIFLAPAIVQGGLQILAISKEGEALGLDGSADEIICSTIGPTTGIAAWIYGETDCGMVYPNPNEDQAATLGPLTYGGFTMTYKGAFVAANGAYCYLVTGSLPTGYGMYYLKKNGTPELRFQGPGLGPTWANDCWPTLPAGAANTHINAVEYSSADQGALAASSRLTWIQRLSDGAKVAEMSEVRADPTRTPKCTVQGGGQSVTRSGTPYTEVEGLPLTSAGLGCAEAYEDFVSAPNSNPMFPEKIQIESESGGSITEIAELDVPAEVQQPKPSEGLKLHRVIGTELRSCMTWEADCASWWTDTQQGTQTGTYRCTFGGAEVDLAECGVYRNTFKDPEDVKIFDPEGEHEYSWGTGNDPYAGPGGSTAPQPTGAGACSPSWSWNPVDWVLNPLKCAFIPGTAAITATQARVVDAFDDTMIGKLPATLAPLMTVPNLGAGCEGPHVYVPLELNGSDATIDWYPFQACEAPGSTIAAYARNIGAVILVFLTALGIFRRIASVVRAPGIGSEAGSP